jgi:Predicted ATPase
MLRESARQPLVLVFEDAHWADGETRELLDEIADSIPVAHVLMLVTYRPEYQHGLDREELLHPAPGGAPPGRERRPPGR